jgi:hypothetical protein
MEKACIEALTALLRGEEDRVATRHLATCESCRGLMANSRPQSLEYARGKISSDAPPSKALHSTLWPAVLMALPAVLMALVSFFGC